MEKWTGIPGPRDRDLGPNHRLAGALISALSVTDP